MAGFAKPAALGRESSRVDGEGGEPGEAEQRLLERLIAGDGDAFRAIAESHLNAVVRFAARFLASHAEAEDVAQETFLKLWQTAAALDPHTTLRTWLYRVAHNACIDRARHRRVATAHVAAAEAEPSTIESPQPMSLLESKRIAEKLSAALQLLPERQRSAVLLAHYDELSNEQAAAVLELSVSAYESLLARARRALREALRAHAPELLSKPAADGDRHD